MNRQFQRPNNIKSGVLLNTDNQSLQDYKKAKKKLSKINKLESQIEQLTKIVLELQDKYNNESK